MTRTADSLPSLERWFALSCTERAAEELQRLDWYDWRYREIQQVARAYDAGHADDAQLAAARREADDRSLAYGRRRDLGDHHRRALAEAWGCLAHACAPEERFTPAAQRALRLHTADEAAAEALLRCTEAVTSLEPSCTTAHYWQAVRERVDWIEASRNDLQCAPIAYLDTAITHARVAPREQRSPGCGIPLGVLETWH